MKTRTLIVAAMLLSTGIAAAQPRPEPTTPVAAPAAPDLTPVVAQTDINAPADEVWRVFSTEEGWKKMGVALVKLDLRPGGHILSHYNPKGVLGDEGTIDNEVIAFDPGHVFAFRISKPPKTFPFMNAYKSVWSVVTITDLGNGRTNLRLAQNGYTADEESQKMRAFFAQGNQWVLDKLKKNLEAAPVTKEEPKAATPADPLAPIVAEAVINAMPSDVWTSLTTHDGVKAFLTDNRVELRVGGPFELYFAPPDAPAGERGSEGCTILSYEPGRMLSFSWNAPPKLPYARSRRTWVVIRIDPAGPHATKVTLTHMGFVEEAKLSPEHEGEWRECRAYFVNAWPKVLSALVRHYE